MSRKSRKRKNRPDKYRGGTTKINRLDYTIRDYISPGRLMAWAEWIPNQPRGVILYGSKNN